MADKAMRKIVINAGYGGFRLSEAAEHFVLRDARSGYLDGSLYLHRHRDNAVLVDCVDKLGKGASGPSAYLAIVEIPADIEWKIFENDGYEWVAEAHRTWHGTMPEWDGTD